MPQLRIELRSSVMFCLTDPRNVNRVNYPAAELSSSLEPIL